MPDDQAFPYHEQIAAITDYLTQEGMPLLAPADWTCEEGTADLIACHGHTLVVIAVAETPEDVNQGLFRTRLEKLRQVADSWAASHPAAAASLTEIRVDVYRLCRDPGNGQQILENTRNVGGLVPLRTWATS